MPVTRSRTYLDMSFEDSNNTTGFLFDDEENSLDHLSSGTAHDSYRSAYRPQSFISMSALTSGQMNGSGSVGAQSPESTTKSNPNSRPASIRHSIDMKVFQDMGVPSAPDTPSGLLSPSMMATAAKAPSTFSNSELTTGKTTNGSGGLQSSANNHAQQHLHNHNASIGRIPAGAMPNRHSREMSGDAQIGNGFGSIGSTLQANAAPFGPLSAAQSPVGLSPNGATSPSGASTYSAFSALTPYMSTPYAGNAHFNVPVMMPAMNVNANHHGGSMGPMYAPAAQGFGGPGPSFTPNTGRQVRDSQARVIQSRRQLDSEAMARYVNMPLESCVGQIYQLCKDQHGCRYLQRQIDSRNPEKIHMVWLETNNHVVELMSDPFGNYLCQKLFEHCESDERTVLIRNASKHMVQVALNQHGTRALQKMIEFVNGRVQIDMIIEALRYHVVELIKDLNGNHVIQKCIQKLTTDDAAFIFTAVGQKCTEVASHRHGCCVMQRCIDHSHGRMKTWLVQQLINNACLLVQDPFGNYVVQYIVDQNEVCFTEPLVQQFRGRVVCLSKHKFSSNVIEKCLRCSSDESKDMMVSELVQDAERLLKDSYGNYVIQTALDYATDGMKPGLIKVLRPALPAVRNTPYGRRIATKIHQYDEQQRRAVTHAILHSAIPAPLRQVSWRPRTDNTDFHTLTDLAAAMIEANTANLDQASTTNVEQADSTNVEPADTNGNGTADLQPFPPVLPQATTAGQPTSSTESTSPVPRISSTNPYAALNDGVEENADNSNWF